MTSDEIKAQKLIEKLHEEYVDINSKDISNLDKDYAFRDIWFNRFAYPADGLDRLNHHYVIAHYEVMRLSLLSGNDVEYRIYDCKKYKLSDGKEKRGS